MANALANLTPEELALFTRVGACGELTESTCSSNGDCVVKVENNVRECAAGPALTMEMLGCSAGGGSTAASAAPGVAPGFLALALSTLSILFAAERFDEE